MIYNRIINIREVIAKKNEDFLKDQLKKGMTQEQLTEKVGTTKSYISKIEDNIKAVRLSTLKKIIELGLEGNLEF